MVIFSEYSEMWEIKQAYNIADVCIIDTGFQKVWAQNTMF